MNLQDFDRTEYEIPFTESTSKRIIDELVAAHLKMVESALLDRFRKELGLSPADIVPEEEALRLAKEVVVVRSSDGLVNIYEFRGKAILSTNTTFRDNRIRFDIDIPPVNAVVLLGANGPVGIGHR